MEVLRDDILNNIYKKNPSHQKYINNSFSKYPEMKIAMDSFLKTYKKFMEIEELSASDIANAYSKMLKQIDFSRREFLKNGNYYLQTQKKAFVKIYNDEVTMKAYMLGGALSMFLWPHHFKNFTFLQKHIASLNKERKFLEIGSGHGLFLLELLKNIKNYDIIDVIDISKTSIRLTQNIIKSVNQNYLKDITFYNQNIYETSNKQKYDFIIFGEVIEHLDNPLKALETLYQLLNNNGSIFITTCVNCPMIDHIYLFNNIQEIKEIIKKANFYIEHEIITPASDKNENFIKKMKIDISYAAIIKKL
ncbi:class I SAM-dependent methyltransferase [Sulfurimonas sp.]